MPETEVSKKFHSLYEKFKKIILDHRKFIAANPILELKQKKKVEESGAALIYQQEASAAILSILAEELTLLKKDMQAMIREHQHTPDQASLNSTSTTTHPQKEDGAA